MQKNPNTTTTFDSYLNNQNEKSVSLSPISPEQGVRYSQKFCSKHGFPYLPNGTISQFSFPKYLIEC